MSWGDDNKHHKMWWHKILLGFSVSYNILGASEGDVTKMGRLEKQIIAAAIALLGILLIAVLFADGLTFTPDAEQSPTQFADPIAVHEAAPSLQIRSGSTVEAKVIDLFAPQSPKLDLASASAPRAIDSFQVNHASSATPAAQVVAQPADLPALITYKVQPGDVFSRIVSKQLGSIKRIPDVLAVNPGLDPDILMPGDEILIPNPLIAIPATAKKELSVVAATVHDLGQASTSHKVVSGDSLWKLARKYLGNGNPSSMQRFVDANPDLGDVDAVLQIGQVLAVPQ
jgi:LysM repeat protein